MSRQVQNALGTYFCGVQCLRRGVRIAFVVALRFEYISHRGMSFPYAHIADLNIPFSDRENEIIREQPPIERKMILHRLLIVNLRYQEQSIFDIRLFQLVHVYTFRSGNELMKYDTRLFLLRITRCSHRNHSHFEFQAGRQLLRTASCFINTIS